MSTYGEEVDRLSNLAGELSLYSETSIRDVVKFVLQNQRLQIKWSEHEDEMYPEGERAIIRAETFANGKIITYQGWFFVRDPEPVKAAIKRRIRDAMMRAIMDTYKETA